MAFLFDHLTAVVVGSVLLVGLLVTTQRGRQSAVEASIRYRAEVQTASFAETLTRDLENARTSRQAKAALGLYARDALDGPRERALEIQGSTTQTEWLQFVTLAEPASGSASPLVAVSYRLEPTGEQLRANGAVRSLHRIVRYVHTAAGWEAQGGSMPTVVGFQVTVPGGATGQMEDLPERVEVAVETAYEMPTMQAGDQAETAEVGLTRQGATVRVYAAGTDNRVLPPPQNGAPGIARPPWVLPYVPYVPPPPPPTNENPSPDASPDEPPPTPTGGGGTRSEPDDEPPPVVRPTTSRDV